jgi:katanin p60 ATPase-containing subunit A1
MYPDG